MNVSEQCSSTFHWPLTSEHRGVQINPSPSNPLKDKHLNAINIQVLFSVHFGGILRFTHTPHTIDYSVYITFPGHSVTWVIYHGIKF